jgi:PPK2 family polyphosphate:nucleotide phosphotransferase
MAKTRSARSTAPRLDQVLDTFRVVSGNGFRLGKIDPADTCHLNDEHKSLARQWLAEGVAQLAELQDKLYAQDRRSLLVVFQAMDAAGKDGTIKHVMSGVNPQGVQVHSFKRPSEEELDHDYLWRAWRVLPERGRIGIFNRSYYEEALVVRVHREVLAAQKLPADCVSRRIFDERLRDMARFEDYLHRNGTRVLKFFLHVSRDEQKRRFLKRIDEPARNWKFEAGDVRERAHWTAYMSAYEAAIRGTASPRAPWYVVPADNKWFTRLVVVSAIIRALREMDLAYPTVDAERLEALSEARKVLMAEAEPGRRRVTRKSKA